MREVFGGAAAFAAGPEAFAAGLRDALAAGPEPRRRAAGQALAARYTWAEAAARHLALYRAIASAPGLPGGRHCDIVAVTRPACVARRPREGAQS